MNPFDVLGLSDAAPTRADVRRAYAARLRVHPPDRDPAGFRRIRDAYEALAGLGDAELAAWAAHAQRGGGGSSGRAPEDEDADEPGTTARPIAPSPSADAPWPDTPPPNPLRPDTLRPDTLRPATLRPEAAPAALGTFEADLRARLDAATSAADRLEIVRGVMPAAERDPALARATARVVAATDPSDEKTLAAAATPTFAMALLASGDESTVADLAARWNRPEHWPHLIEWAQHADDHVPPIAALASPEALVALAREVAVLRPHTALHLADEAFVHAPPDRRAGFPMDDVDRWARASIALGDDQPAARRGLALWAIGPPVAGDAAQAEALEALDAVVELAAQAVDDGTDTDDDRRLIDEIDAVAEDCVDAAWGRVEARREAATARTLSPPPPRRRRTFVLQVVAVLLVAGALHVLSQPPPRTVGPSRPKVESPRDALERLDRRPRGRAVAPVPAMEPPPPGWKPLTPAEEEELEALRRLPAPVTDDALRRRRDDLEYRASFMRRR